MKTFQNFSEDIESRRQELRQRQIDQMKNFKERSQSYAAAQRERLRREQEKERLKKEIKQELEAQD